MENHMKYNYLLERFTGDTHQPWHSYSNIWEKKENNGYLSLLQAVAAQAAPPVRHVVAREEEPGADPLLVARRCAEIVPLLALALPPVFSLNSWAANEDRRQNFHSVMIDLLVRSIWKKISDLRVEIGVSIIVQKEKKVYVNCELSCWFSSFQKYI
jgi:hypothetical protein